MPAFCGLQIAISTELRPSLAVQQRLCSIESTLLVIPEWHGSAKGSNSAAFFGGIARERPAAD
jgi:hypothetical protein